MKLAACIVGLGQVGIKFDLEEERRQDPRDIWTHFSAYTRLSDRYELVAVVDPDERAWAHALQKRPALRCFRSIAELLASGIPLDVASICTPDALHLENAEALRSNVSGLFLEKPLCLPDQLPRAESLLKDARARGMAIYVNYYKRCEPSVLKTLEGISARKEVIRHVSCRYSGPFLAVGSHALDLLNVFASPLHIRGALKNLADEGDGCSALLDSDAGVSASLIHTGRRHEFIFELDVITDQSRYLLTDNLARFARAELVPSSRFKGYSEFKPVESSEHWSNPNRFVHFLERMWTDISRKRTGSSPDYGNADLALSTQKLLRDVAQAAAGP